MYDEVRDGNGWLGTESDGRVMRGCLMKSVMNGKSFWVMLGMFDEIRDGNERFGTEEGAWELW